MSDLYGLRIDLSRLATRLSAELGKTFDADEISAWLREAGFDRTDDGWVADASLVGLLEESEVSALWPPDEPSDSEEFPSMAAEPPAFKPYVLTAAEKQSLSQVPGYEHCIIPTFLCGSPAAIRSNWSSYARKIIRHGRIAPVMANVPFVHLDNVPGIIRVDKPIGLSRASQIISIYPILEILSELIADVSKNSHENYIITRQLMIDGLDHFWFCMCFMAAGDFGLRSQSAGYATDFELVRREAVAKVLKWWPHLCARQSRFKSDLSLTTSSWRMQWRGLYELFDPQGTWQQLQKMSCGELGDYIRRSLEKS